MKENKKKLKEKTGKLIENKRKLIGTKGKWKGNVFNFLCFCENFQKSRKMASSEQRINQFTLRKITGKLKGNKGELKENKGKLKEKSKEN